MLDPQKAYALIRTHAIFFTRTPDGDLPSGEEARVTPRGAKWSRWCYLSLGRIPIIQAVHLQVVPDRAREARATPKLVEAMLNSLAKIKDGGENDSAIQQPEVPAIITPDSEILTP